MRITDGKNPLDATSVHPESYKAATLLLEKTDVSIQAIDRSKFAENLKNIDLKAVAAETQTGEITLRDIIDAIEKPARDVRDSLPKPVLKSELMSIENLKDGMILTGTVRNVIDFGAFVDIGVHQDGLVHISEICDRYIKHPKEALSVGDVVNVKVLSVDMKKNRISFSVKQAK